MVEAHWEGENASVAAESPADGYYRATFLEEVLFDLTLAVDLGAPVFLLGAKGGGKSALARQAARRLGGRYHVAWLEGHPKLALNEVVEVCRRGFDPEVWKTLPVRPVRSAQELRRPSDNLLIVENTEAISPRFLEQLVAVSNGYEDLMPSHRVLLVAHSELAPLIEVSQLRNNWGPPVVLRLPPWPDYEVAPFLRHRMLCAGLRAPEALTDAVVMRIAQDAAGNPGRMLELAQDALHRAGHLGTTHLDMDPPEPPPRRPSIDASRPTLNDFELMSGPIAPHAPPALTRQTEHAIADPAALGRHGRSRAWPIAMLAAAAALGGLGVWAVGQWSAADRQAPRSVANAPAAPITASIQTADSTPPGERTVAAPAKDGTVAAAPPAAAPPPPAPVPVAGPEPAPNAPTTVAQAPAAQAPAIQAPVAQAPAIQAAAAVEAPSAPVPTLAPAPETPPRETAATAAPVADALAPAAPPAAALPAPAPPPVQATVVVPPAPEPAPPAPSMPTPVVVQPSPPPAPAPVLQRSVPSQQVEDLIERGNTLLRTGDFAAARLFYVQAARAGSAKAATAVAWTYDPQVLDHMGVIGNHGDPAKALEWYRKAMALGDDAAAEPLRRLSGQ